MNEYPSVYRYVVKEKEFELYLGEISLLEGLRAVDKNIKIRVITIEAQDWDVKGWYTEEDFPSWKNVGELVAFLDKHTHEDIDDFIFINFDIELLDYGTLSSHDDAECSFSFIRKKDLIEVFTNLSDPKHRMKLADEIFNKPGTYISIDKEGEIIRYRNFDDYIIGIKMKD